MAALGLSGTASRLSAPHDAGALVAPQLEVAADLSRRLGASANFCARIYGE